LGQVPLAGEKGNMEPVFAEIQRHFDSNGAAKIMLWKTCAKPFRA